MAIDPHRFEGRLEAGLTYALLLTPEEASARFEAIWKSGAWRSNPTCWLQRVNRMGDKTRWTPERAGVVTLETLQALGWEACKPHLYNAFLLWADGTDALAGRVAEWVTSPENADAGDVDVVLKGAERFLTRFAVPASRLVDWVLEHGISGLRNPHRLELVRELFLHLADVGRTEDAASLLNLLASLDRGLVSWPDHLPLWKVVERAALDPELVVELVLGLLRVGATHLAFSPMRDVEAFPRTGHIVFVMLAGGVVPHQHLEVGWKVALKHLLPNDSSLLCDIGSLDVGIKQLTWCELNVTAWSRLFADAYFELWRDPTDERDTLSVPAVRSLAGRNDEGAIGVAQALEPRLRARTDESAVLASDILKEGAWTCFRVVAALDCLAPTPTARTQATIAPDEREVENLRMKLERFVCTAWPANIFGLDVGALLKNVSRVELVALDAGDKVRLDGSTLRVDRTYPDELIVLGVRDDDLLQAAYLYVAHELVHLPQGLGDIKTVRRLRAAGGESNLLHLDLVADHLATLMVHTAVRRWSIVTLKSAILDSLAHFPTGPFATDASRLRKSTRYASERLDLLIRQRDGNASSDNDGYWFLDFGPLGGPAFAFQSGPPMRLVGEVPLSKEDTDTLLHAADGPDAAAKADRVVERIAKALRL